MPYLITSVPFAGGSPPVAAIVETLTRRTGLAVKTEAPLDDATAAELTLSLASLTGGVTLQLAPEAVRVDANDSHPYLARAIFAALAELGGEVPGRTTKPIEPWAKTPHWPYRLRSGAGRVLSHPLFFPAWLVMELVATPVLAVAQVVGRRRHTG